MNEKVIRYNFGINYKPIGIRCYRLQSEEINNE